MAIRDEEFAELQARVAALTRRVYELEREAGLNAQGQSVAPTAPAKPAEFAQPAAPIAPSSPSNNVPRTANDAGAQARTASPRPDLESRIGSQWLNRIGIIAVLTGAAYFLKLAFDNNWIGPSGRIAIGLLAGVGLVIWSQTFFRKGYKAFSYSLAAAGIGVMYLSLWAAFQLYQLMPSSVAFVAMVAVTAASAVLALRNDAEILAAVAIAGGFATPALLSSGQNHEVALFSYVALLDIAVIALASRRPWHRLLLGAYLGTLILYLAWAEDYYQPALLGTTLFFVTIFFALFASVSLVRKLRPDAEGIAERLLLALPVVNAAVYFLQVYRLLGGTQQESYRPWVALVLAALYIVSARLLAKQDHEAGSATTPKRSELGRGLHLAVGIGFLTIAIPLKLESHWITIGWLVESAALLYVAERSKSGFLRGAAIVALALGLARLLFMGDFHTETIFFNARFATYVVALAVVGGIIWTLRGDYDALSDDQRVFRNVMVVSFNLLALMALGLEVSDVFARRMALGHENTGYLTADDYRSRREFETARDFTYSAVWMLYGGALMTLGFLRRSAFLRWQALILIAVTILKVFFFDLSSLSSGLRVLSFIALGVLLLGISFAYQKDWLKLSQRSE